MFKRLYLETSELVAAGWPRVSADLENVLKTTAAIEVPVLLPAGVQLELENSWSRERGERTGAVWSKIRSLEAHFSGVRDMKIALDLPDPARALESYRRAVEAVMQRHHMLPIPFTGRSVAEVFRMAAERHPPFKETKEDVGFRDAAILLSVIDDLLATTRDGGVLVARDRAFHDPRIIDFAERAGAELKVFSSVEAVFDSLMGEVVQYVREQWSQLAAQVQRSLTAQLPGIATFIQKTLEIPEWGLVAGSRVVAVSRIEARNIRDVRVPNPVEVRGLERVRLSFDVLVKFHAQLERIDLPQARRLKIGSERSYADVRAALQSVEAAGRSMFAVQLDETEVDRLVRVEANSDPRFEAFAFESAALVPEGIPGLSGLSGLSVGL